MTEIKKVVIDKHKAPKSSYKENYEEVQGKYDDVQDWVMDLKGYFLIRVNKETGNLELAHCRKNNIIEVKIIGKRPQDVYFEAIKRNLISRLDHAAYIGKELEKAYLALKLGKEYVQDEELKLD